MKKKLLSFILSIVMVITIIPIAPIVVSASVLGDDYPYHVGPDDWYSDGYGFYQGECTSFVAYRLNTVNGLSFSNYYVDANRVHNDIYSVENNAYGTRLGDAKYWGTALNSMGYTVDSNPKVGAIAWDSSDLYGHVAWVSEVNGNDVTIEEYNWAVRHGYGKRTLPKNSFRYIHVKDLSSSTPSGPSFPGYAFYDDFYAYIVADNDNTHAYLSAYDDGYVKLSQKNDDYDPRQIWHFIKHGDDNQYEIINEYDRKCLDVAYNGTGSGSRLQVFEDNDSAAQRFKLKYNTSTDYSFFIYSMLNKDCCLDVSGGSFARGNPIQLYQSNNSEAQSFAIYPLDWNKSSWNGETYSVPKPAAPKITTAYSYGNVLNLKWTESPKANLFDTIRKYEVWINDSNNNLIDAFNVGNKTECTYFLPNQGSYNVRVVASSCSYYTSVVPAYTSSDTVRVTVSDEACASLTDSQTGNIYLLFDTYRDYNGAKQYCETLGGHLATITSADEQKSIDSLCANGNNNYYWLGGTDEKAEGSWEWITGEKWSYSNWNKGEPSNSDGNEDYVHYINSSKNWNDTISTSQMGFICEIEKSAITSTATKEITFNGNTYTLYDQPLPWTEAKTFCESVGGHLVTINSANENAAILSLISSGTKLRYWIGATTENAKNWTWITGENFDYTNWNAGEPNNDCGIEKYAHIFVSDSKDGLWNDVSNYMYLNGYGFICEKENRSYTVSYNANGGTGAPSSQTKTYNEKLVLSSVEPIRNDYVFCGWSADPNAVTPDYQPGSSYSVNADITLYAVWIQPYITLSPEAITIKTGESYLLDAVTYPDLDNSSSGVIIKNKGAHISWNSSDTTIATVTNPGYNNLYKWQTGGTVTALKPGTTVITAKFEYKGLTYSSTCVVKVECPHTNTTNVEATASTCTDPGTTGGSVCADCGMVVAEAEVIPALGHDYTLTETPASCTEDGTRVYTCENCNDTYSETVPALGHSYASVVTEATCTTAGYTTYTCTRCDDSYVADETAALGHDYVDGICSRCGAEDPDAKDPCEGYTDINRNSWYHDAADFVISRGLMGSTKTNALTFEPNTPCTRSMIVMILYNIAGTPDVSYVAKFPDVKDGQWYTKAVMWAYQNGIVSGYDNGKFGPNDKVTREQMAVVLKGYADFIGKDTSKTADLSKFPDGNKATWSKSYISWAVAEGLINGKAQNGQTYLDPQGVATRAEVAALIRSFVLNILEAK